MSGFIVKDVAALLDPVTRQIVGYLDADGKERPFDAAAMQSVVGAESMPGNRYITLREQRARDLRNAQQFPGPTLVFKFDEGTGSNVYEANSQRYAALSSGGTVTWDAQRGVLFNGNGAFQFASPSTSLIDAQAGQICDLSTLQVGEEITVALVYSHGIGISGSHVLMYYGVSGDATYGGWGLHVTLRGKLVWRHRAVGSAGETTTSLSNRDPENTAANNTLTAAVISIRLNPTNTEFFEIAYADRPLLASAEVNSRGFSIINPLVKGDSSGTSAAKQGTLGTLTFGARPNASYTGLASFAGASGAFVGLRFLALQRQAWVPGRFHRILQDLAADYSGNVPAGLFVEP